MNVRTETIKPQRKKTAAGIVSCHPHLSSAILASGRGGFGGATSSSGVSEAGSTGVAVWAVLFETSCSRSIEGISDGTSLHR